ncbi:MAG: outer membrane protein assembly factor BamB family protein [Planctomycetota bacterium]|jgi:outer membrane protein assembly factor BamB
MRVRREFDEVNRRQFLKQSGATATGIAASLAGTGLLPGLAQIASAAKQPAEAGATAWPSFRNGNQLQGISSSSLPKSLELLWKVPVDDGVTATAAIVGDHVYAGTFGGELICFDRKTGERVWTHFSAEKKKPNDFIPGFQSSPTVTGDLVLIGDEDGVFHAVDRATGKPRWKYETFAEIISSAAVVGERIIFGSYDATLYCLNAADGKELWKFETADRINGSPAVAGSITFVTGCDTHLRAINIETGKEEFDMPLERFLIASPAVFDGMLYVGSHESEFLAIEIAKQEIVWQFRNERSELPIHSSAAVTNEVVVFGGQDKQLHCLDRKTGKEKWSFSTRGQINSSPVIVDNDRVFFGSNDGNLYEVGLADGKQRWKEKLGRSVTASPAIGEGCLVIGAEGTEGEIYCFGTK